MRVPLTGGAYTAHSVVASAQRQLNLYGEPMPPDQHEPQPQALYPTAGTRLLGTMAKAPIRGIREATNGALYVVAGDTIYSVGADWSGSSINTITPGLRTPVSMADNGLTMVVVDGTSGGWTVALADNAFAAISDPVFRGADRVDYSDTYLLFNVPGTPQFHSSDSLAVTPFDPLWFANKEAVSDLLMTLVVASRKIWLLGQKTTEIWYNSGAPDFPWATEPNVLIDHGIAAIYSAAEADNAVIWLSRNRQGHGIVVEGQEYKVDRISTYAMEAEFATYDRISDAIGMTYQYNGHNFYQLTFPHVSKTWLYDKTTKQWSELCWLDSNGTEHRHRANCAAFARGLIVMGDWQSGNLYALDPAVYTDCGKPIKRERGYPHLLSDGKRVFYRQFLADLEGGDGLTEAVVTET